MGKSGTGSTEVNKFKQVSIDGHQMSLAGVGTEGSRLLRFYVWRGVGGWGSVH